MSNEWENEPDNVLFTDDATGLFCAMKRGPGGHWCGYVALPEDHPLHGKSYSDPVQVPEGYMDREVKLDEDYGAISLFLAQETAKPEKNIWPLDLAVRCHGGVTYSEDRCPGSDPDGAWWLGFDCAHSGDLCPKYTTYSGEIYRNVEYVKSSLAKMCGDLAALRAIPQAA